MTEGELQLPRLLDLPTDHEQRVDLLYGVYLRDLVKTCPTVGGVSVVINRKTIYAGKQEMFWHLIQHGQQRGDDGDYDHQRAIRLPWIRTIIDDQGKSSEVRAFRHESKPNVIRYYLWHFVEHYRIVLEKVGATEETTEFVLITAHYLDFKHARDGMERKYQQRC